VNRYCWIKGDLTFEALRQAVLEPEDRVWLGTEAPEDLHDCVAQVKWKAASWLQGDGIPLNPGLVTIIGPRGSGKTALVDLVAAGSGALKGPLSESSFLCRASKPIDRLAAAQTKVLWHDGSGEYTELAAAVSAADLESAALTCYLSQHFVERLCSAAGLATDLRREMERVVFDATDPLERQEARDFDELVATLVQPLRRSRGDLVSWINDLVERIDTETSLIEKLPKLRQQAEDLREQSRTLKSRIETLLPKGAEDRTQALLALEEAYTKKEKLVEALRRQRTQLDSLLADVRGFHSTRAPAFLAELQGRYLHSVLTPEDWDQFRLQFAGDVERVIATHETDLDRRIAEAEGGAGAAGQTGGSDEFLSSLRVHRDEARKAVGMDAEKQKEYQRQQAALAQHQTTLRSAEAAVKEAEGADARRSTALSDRAAAYQKVMATIVDEEQILQRLYEPLQARLQGSTGALARIEFFVRREVALDDWVAQGESLFDLRRDFVFKGHGALAGAAREALLPSWQDGSAEDVARDMEQFLAKYRQELLKGRPQSIPGEQIHAWRRNVGRWIYATDHIRIEYGIRYAGVAIEQLSPGTRGIVLLLVFLAVDQHDQRPLIVDQPEENLDPKSVFEELVPHFREARKRRQVIVVTHNANLVVNTDADQVVVAHADPSATGGLPQISYTSGSLENPEIRSAVCQLLEGGERAFLEREKRYRLRWRE
jgi:energy-coupling factor transporter ATP-binding protein EcfA2